MDRQYSLACNGIQVNDWLHYTKHWSHMNQGKDLYIFHWHMHVLQGIRNSVCILVYSLVADQYNFVHKNRPVDYWHHGIGKMVRREMERKDSLVHAKLVVLLGINFCFMTVSWLGSFMILTFFFKTSNEWISNMMWKTTAYRTVIYYMTLCVYSACVRTRVNTFLISTGFALYAVWAYNTFWMASRWTADISFSARANSMIIQRFAFTIRSARWGMT